MISLDSIKVSADIEALKDFKKGDFKHNISIDEGKRTSWLTSKSQYLGFKSVKIFDNNLEIETSAKILKSNYLDGLNQNTFEKYIESINETGMIELYPDKFYKTAKVHKVDVTQNIFPSDIEKSIRDLSIFSTKRGYEVRPYNTGIEAYGKAKSNTCRLIAYGKEADLMRPTKSNEELLKYVDINKAKGVLRIESNFRNYQAIRGAFHLKKNESLFMSNILESPINVLSETFEKLYNLDIEKEKAINKKGLLMIALMDSDRTYHQALKEWGMRIIIEQCKYNIETIKKILKRKIKGNISGYVREYEKLMKVMEYEKLEYNFHTISEIKDLLNKSA